MALPEVLHRIFIPPKLTGVKGIPANSIFAPHLSARFGFEFATC